MSTSKEAAATEGAQVLLASSAEARVRQALKALPAGIEGHVLDLSKTSAIEAFFDVAGPFDHLIYTAGESLKLSSLAEGDIASARGFFELRYWGAFMAARWRGIAWSGRAARLCSHPGWRERDQGRAGRSRPASAARWRG
jgi:NADP-dependent 3-hydroxy acid dehydrogenase YdfG